MDLGSLVLFFSSRRRTVASWFNIIQFGVALFSKELVGRKCGNPKTACPGEWNQRLRPAVQFLVVVPIPNCGLPFAEFMSPPCWFKGSLSLATGK